MFNGEIIFHYLKRIGMEKHIWAGVFIDLKICILKEGRNFKTLSKEHYAIALVSCYLITKKKLIMDLNMMFSWCLWSFHTLEIRELYSRFDEYLAI